MAEVTEQSVTAESLRLEEVREKGVPWRQWGPYLSERQWGTVREDYSDNGDAWNYFSHDQARSRAYHWGEDGLAGVSDDQQRLCFSVALWNGKDPILKERVFGLTNSEANHGEDVKDYYFYLDSTPTHRRALPVTRRRWGNGNHQAAAEQGSPKCRGTVRHTVRANRRGSQVRGGRVLSGDHACWCQRRCG
jgi:hypothetical protein